MVDKTFQLNDKFELKRAELDEVADFICKDLDEAATLLPEKYDDSELGRATKGAALALKSRILLYKASPLFGTPSRENGKLQLMQLRQSWIWEYILLNR